MINLTPAQADTLAYIIYHEADIYPVSLSQEADRGVNALIHHEDGSSRKINIGPTGTMRPLG